MGDTSFSDLLQQEFNRRKISNPRYSLRAFARDLRVDPSYLSKLLRGIRKPTDKWLHLLKLEAASRDVLIKRTTPSTKPLSIFDIAVLESLRIKSVEPTAESLANFLQVEEAAIKKEFDKLCALMTIEKIDALRWAITEAGVQKLEGSIRAAHQVSKVVSGSSQKISQIDRQLMKIKRQLTKHLSCEKNPSDSLYMLCIYLIPLNKKIELKEGIATNE